jgi:OOP family OmpA-OmpF porin
MKVYKAKFLGGLMILSAVSFNVMAADEVKSYLVDSSGNVVTSSSGDCVRTSGMTDKKLEECGYKKAAAPEPVRVEVVAAPKAVTMTTKVMEKIELEAAMLFDFDSAKLTPDAKAVIDERIERLKGKVKLTSIMKVEGHTDSSGPEAYNLKLSQERAQAVADYIVANAARVSTSDIEVIGKGESEPAHSNDTREGRQLNRRVVVFAEGEVVK